MSVFDLFQSKATKDKNKDQLPYEVVLKEPAELAKALESVYGTTHDSTSYDDVDDVAALMDALQVASKTVSIIKSKINVIDEQNDGQKMDSGAGEDGPRTSLLEEEMGIPKRGAKLRHSRECAKCTKRISTPFAKGYHCHSCGFMFCRKCAMHKQILPHRFGYGDIPMRACDDCVNWFQSALDRIIDEKSSTEQSSSNHSNHGRRSYTTDPSLETSILLTPSHTYPSELPPQSQNSSTSLTLDSPAGWLLRQVSIAYKNGAVSSSVKQSIKHMIINGEFEEANKVLNDMLPPLSNSPSEMSESGDEEDDDDEEDATDIRKERMQTRTMSCDAVEWRDRSSRPKSNSVLESQLMLMNSRSNSLGPGAETLENAYYERLNDSHEDIYLYRGSSRKNLVRANSYIASTPRIAEGDHESEPEDIIEEKMDNDHDDDRGRSRIREDVNVLHSAPERSSNSSNSSSTDSLIIIRRTRSPTVPRPNSAQNISREKKPRSLSVDVVTEIQRKRSVSADAVERFRDRNYDSASLVTKAGSSSVLDPSIVEVENPDFDEMSMSLPKFDTGSSSSPLTLHFAVSRISSRDSLRRTFGFAKKTSVKDRFTLEVSRVQGIVQAKGVFRHRFWTFRCDAVQELNDSAYGEECLEIVVAMGQGNEVFAFQFATVGQKKSFSKAVNEWMMMPPPLSSTSASGLLSLNELSVVSSPSQSTSQGLSSLPPISLANDLVFAASGTNHHMSMMDASPASSGGQSSVLEHHHVGNLANSKETPRNMMNLLRTSSSSSRSGGAQAPIVIDFLPGEKEVNGTAWPATMILGPRATSTSGEEAWGHIRGVISITNYRVIFIPFDVGFVSMGRSMVYIPLFAIVSVQRENITRQTTNNAGGLVIHCKDFRSMCVELDGHLSVTEERTQALTLLITALSESIQRIGKNTIGDQQVNTSSSSGSFAHYYTLKAPPNTNGWNVYDIQDEFERQMVHIDVNSPTRPHLKLVMNQHGELCRSYPSKVLLPCSFTTPRLYSVAAFRAKGRLPAVTWYHRHHGCVLTRSGQPLLGNILTGSASRADQELVDFYRKLPGVLDEMSGDIPARGYFDESVEDTRPLYIFDARKVKASTGNRIMGKGGVETTQDYPGAVIHHLNIGNIYRMQASYQALMKLLLPGGNTDKLWWSSVESTRWLEHIRLLLEGAMKIARVLDLEKASVLVHCSDGWDRTSQLTALAQIMIDPYYRSIRGFAVLVEKDWCDFGHKFAERLGGDRDKDATGAKCSPIFLQFIDAVWQMTCQFPSAFEFNEEFLLHLANALTSGLYGTFLYDFRLQREAHGVRRNTVSVWTPVLSDVDRYTNRQYVAPHDNDHCHLNYSLWPWASQSMIRLWDTYYFQWHPKYSQNRWISTGTHGRRRPEEMIRRHLEKRKRGSSAHTIGMNSVPTPMTL